MKIPELETVQMMRTDPQHFGNGKIVPLTKNVFGNEAVSSVEKVTQETEAVSIKRAGLVDGKSFQDFLLEAVNNVNTQQNDVAKIQEKMITNPDEIDLHDVTLAMSKARMSLNLAQTVIDRLVTDWNEITTTR